MWHLTLNRNLTCAHRSVCSLYLLPFAFYPVFKRKRVREKEINVKTKKKRHKIDRKNIKQAEGKLSRMEGIASHPRMALVRIAGYYRKREEGYQRTHRSCSTRCG